MSKKQLMLSSVENVFKDYIKVFNEDYQTYLPANQRQQNPISTMLSEQWEKLLDNVTVNQIQINSDDPMISMVSIKEVTDLLKQQAETLNQKKLYRMAILLNTISGDIQTTMANQVVCFGSDGERYLLLEKEPAQDADGVYYYYSLHSEPYNTDVKKLFNSVNYLMTDENIQEVLNGDKLQGFASLKQQQALIQNSILKIEDFDEFEM